MSKTKEKIISAALKLFNENGLVNVRLQHIADEAFISVGNLAYHYANKEAIIQRLYNDLSKRQDDLMTEYRIVPLFDNIDRLLHLTFELQSSYKFFYLDILEITRSYPAIGGQHRQRVQSQKAQLLSIVDFNMARGALTRPEEGAYIEAMVDQIWMTIDFWRIQNNVTQSDDTTIEAFKRAVWISLIPHFSDMGRLEYQQMLKSPYRDYFES